MTATKMPRCRKSEYRADAANNFFTEANWLNWLALVSVQNNGARKQTLIGQVMAFVVVSQPILGSHSLCSATAAAAIGAANCLIKKKKCCGF